MSSKKTNGNGKKTSREDDTSSKEHLLVCVHGLFGCNRDLFVPVRAMEKNLPHSILLHIPSVNNGLKSLGGIEACGQRLITDLKDIIAKHENLKTISFVGHSLGGLLSRYCIGHAYDKKRGTVFGLEPLHLITVATPHFGCNDNYLTADLENEHSVTPCLKWLGTMPCMGKVFTFLFHHCEAFFVHMILGETGKNLFLRDEDPILMRMASVQSSNDLDACYLSALSSFKERTCYGNVEWDHLVAWENATIRRKNALPPIPGESVPHGIVNVELSPPASIDADGNGQVTKHATCDTRESMISNLERLGWRRIDVKMKITLRKCALLPHDTIMFRKEINVENFKAVALHLSELYVDSVRKHKAIH